MVWSGVPSQVTSQVASSSAVLTSDAVACLSHCSAADAAAAAAAEVLCSIIAVAASTHADPASLASASDADLRALPTLCERLHAAISLLPPSPHTANLACEARA